MPEKTGKALLLLSLLLMPGSLVPLATGEAAAKTFGEVVVRQEEGFPAASRHGYQEFRFRVFNRSAESAHQVRLGLWPQTGPYGAPGGAAVVGAEIAPGGEALLRLYAHRGLGHRSVLTVEIDGRSAVGSPMALAQGGLTNLRGECFLLLSPSLPIASIPEPMQNRCTPVSAVPAVARWSDHWFAYSGFEGVALPEREWEAAPANVRQALGHFVETGGVVVLLGAAPEPGWETALPIHLASRPPQGDVALRRVEAGFGVLFRTPFEVPSGMPESRLDALFQVLEEGATPWQQLNNPDWAERNFPVIQGAEDTAAGGRRPERGLFLLLAIFALGVGPGAMWWLKRKGRPIWILVVVPLAAVVTCGVLIAALLALEGVEPRQRLNALTLLDQEGRHAVTLGRLALYAPFPPEALPFEAGTQLEPFVYHHWQARQPDRWTDWSTGQRLESGWLPPRVPLHLKVRRVESRRERLSVEWNSTSGPVRVVNGLGAVVERLWLRTPDGRLFTAEGLAMGAAMEAAELEATEAPPVVGPAVGEIRKLLINPWVDAPSKVAAQAPGILTPGTYIAVLEGSPFVEDPLAGRGVRRVRSVVYGHFSDSAEGAP